MSVIWIGSAYTFGAVALAIMLLQDRWTSAIIPVASTLPFAVVMLAATIIHNDRFSTGTVAYYIWLAIYIALPLVLPTILWHNRKRWRRPRPGEPVLPRRLRAAFVAAGLAAAVLGFVLALTPTTISDAWPWPLAPLMGRVIGGWLLFLATGGLAAAFEARYAAYRVYLPAGALWFTILLAGSIAHHGDFDAHNLSTPLYFAAVGFAVVALTATFRLMEHRTQPWRETRFPASPLRSAGESRTHSGR